MYSSKNDCIVNFPCAWTAGKIISVFCPNSGTPAISFEKGLSKLDKHFKLQLLLHTRLQRRQSNNSIPKEVVQSNSFGLFPMITAAYHSATGIKKHRCDTNVAPAGSKTEIVTL